MRITHNIPESLRAQKELCKKYAKEHPEDIMSEVMKNGIGYAPKIAEDIDEYINGHELDGDDVERYIRDHDLDDSEKEYIRKHKHTIPNRYDYKDEVVEKMKEGLDAIRKAYVYAKRIDYLLSGDDGEESFLRRLENDLHKLDNTNETK